jgi:hypothetical protein
MIAEIVVLDISTFRAHASHAHDTAGTRTSAFLPRRCDKNRVRIVLSPPSRRQGIVLLVVKAAIETGAAM